jgi:hypothetical protein
MSTTAIPAVKAKNAEIAVLDQTKLEVELLVEKYKPLMPLRVSDPESAQRATDVLQDVRGAIKRIEIQRKSLTEPMQKRVKELIAYEKDLKAPLEAIEEPLQQSMNAYAHELRLAAEAQARALEEDRRRKEREAEEERKRKEQEFADQQVAEAERLAEANAIFGTDVPLDYVNGAINQTQTHEWEQHQKQLDQEEAHTRVDFAQREWDIRKSRVKNTKPTYKVELIDLEKVPREFLIIELDEKKIIEAYKLKISVPGVKVIEGSTVAIGGNTNMPLARR